MNASFKIGDLVVRRDGGLRMKVAKVSVSDGRVRCTWTRGPVKHTQSFEPAALVAVRAG